jgi:hypothetical protein
MNWGPWAKKAANNLQTAISSVADPAPAPDPDPLERGRDPVENNNDKPKHELGPVVQEGGKQPTDSNR